MRKRSTFDEWFREQFGPMPHPRLDATALRHRVMLAERALTRAELDLKDRMIWDYWRDAALKAWCATATVTKRTP